MVYLDELLGACRVRHIYNWIISGLTTVSSIIHIVCFRSALLSPLFHPLFTRLQQHQYHLQTTCLNINYSMLASHQFARLFSDENRFDLYPALYYFNEGLFQNPSSSYHSEYLSVILLQGEYLSVSFSIFLFIFYSLPIFYILFSVLYFLSYYIAYQMFYLRFTKLSYTFYLERLNDRITYPDILGLEAVLIACLLTYFDSYLDTGKSISSTTKTYRFMPPVTTILSLSSFSYFYCSYWISLSFSYRSFLTF